MTRVKSPNGVLLLWFVGITLCGSAISQDDLTPDRLVTYKQVGESELRLHMFEPTGESGQPRGAIVFFFGGGWKNGQPSQFYPHCRALSQLGMVAASAEYRVFSRDKAHVADCVADAQDAVRYLRSHAAELNIDPKRLAAGGGSAGGHLAAAVATLADRRRPKTNKPDEFRPNALVLFNPALAMAAFPAAEQPTYFDKVELRERLGDEAENLSPLHHVTEGLPPTLILHGEADTTVPLWTVAAFRDRAVEARARCELVTYADQAHGFFNHGREKYQATYDEMVRFLSELGYIRNP